MTLTCNHQKKVKPLANSHSSQPNLTLSYTPSSVGLSVHKVLRPFIIGTSLIFGAASLIGCQDNTRSAEVESATQSESKPAAKDIADVATPELEANTTDKLQIDWSQVDSGVEPIAVDSFQYPFELDSQPVTSYREFFKVDAATAQHNLTVGMASNEALSHVLDQLGSHYISHELTDGENIELIIHTTADVEADRHDYVFSDPFARGLRLPIVIQPDGKKPSSE